MTDIHKIVIPENVELSYEIAGIGSRFVALLIDMTIQALILVGLITALELIGIDKAARFVPGITKGFIVSIILIVSGVVIFGYHIILETSLNGQTAGKMALHIRVCKELGGRLTFWDVLLRNFIRFIDMFPFYCYLVGIVVMFLNKKSKRLGDFAAGTIVVKELSRRNLEQFLANTQLPGAGVSQEPFMAQYPWIQSVLTVITQQDYFLMKDLHSRRRELTNFKDLAAMIIQKIIVKALSAETPVLDPGEIEAVLADMILAYEKTFLLKLQITD